MNAFAESIFPGVAKALANGWQVEPDRPRGAINPRTSWRRREILTGCVLAHIILNNQNPLQALVLMVSIC